MDEEVLIVGHIPNRNIYIGVCIAQILHKLDHYLDLPTMIPLYWPPLAIVVIRQYDVDLRVMVDEVYTRFHLIFNSNWRLVYCSNLVCARVMAYLFLVTTLYVGTLYFS